MEGKEEQVNGSLKSSRTPQDIKEQVPDGADPETDTLNAPTDIEAEAHPEVPSSDYSYREIKREDMETYVTPGLDGRDETSPEDEADVPTQPSNGALGLDNLLVNRKRRYGGPTPQTSKFLAVLHNFDQEDEEGNQSDASVREASITGGNKQCRPSSARAGYFRSNPDQQTLKRRSEQDEGLQNNSFMDHNPSTKRRCPGHVASNRGSASSASQDDESSHQRHENYMEECDVEIPIPDDYNQYHRLMRSALRSELGVSGYSYEGGIVAKKMHGRGRLTLEGNGQFLEGTWGMNRLIELDFGRFSLIDGNCTVFIMKRSNDYLLTQYENHFVARVTLNSMDDLDFTKNIENTKDAFFKQLTVLEISVDEVDYQRHTLLDKVKSLLKSMVSEDADPIIRANTLILLRKYSQNGASIFDIIQDQTISTELREAITVFLEQESLYLKNSFMMILLREPEPEPLNVGELMSKIYIDGIQKHRRMLVAKCPPVLSNLLSELQVMDESKILYVTKSDIDVFDHLVSQPFFEQYKEFVINVADRFIQTLHSIDPSTSPSAVIPVLSPVFSFLVKSFWDIVSAIIEATDGYQYEGMLRNESGNWVIEDKIKFPVDESQDAEKRGLLNFFRPTVKKSSFYHQSLGIQYKILFQMMNHFFPDCRISKKKYEYNFKVLEQDLSLWEKGMKMAKQSVGLARRLTNLSEERLIWLYILDHTIHEVFKDNLQYNFLLRPYNAVLQGQISFLEKSPAESYESFRVLTHSIIRFVTSTAPYFNDAKQKPDVDVEILVQQMWTFSSASQDFELDSSAYSNFRDLIAEYNRYFSLRLSLEAPSGHFSTQISDLIQTLMRIVGTSLKKKSVPTTAVVVYFRSLNDFLGDFRNIDFLGMWYVKSFFHEPEMMEKVDNKLSTGINCSYLVTDTEKFVQKFKLVRYHPPDHYIIQIVSELLKCIETCLDKQWQAENEAELQVAQLESTSVMLDAVRQSFMYLKEQPDYVDFEVFHKESVDPFERLVNECSSLNDLKKRVNVVKESFWYIRKMNEIGIDQALIMFKNINDSPGCEKLLECYNLYVSHFEKYIAEYSSLLSGGTSHSDSLNSVKGMLNEIKPLHFSEWTEEFRSSEIPILLAGLGAIWSILMSKDVSSTGQFLKPHCIQILCVLKLLSVDKSEGLSNHLAQVLTGQGKSLIMGLLSSVFALTGHNVTVMCYSKYLSSRDENEFNDFFQTFKITGMVKYGTFKDMASQLTTVTCDGLDRSLPLHQLVSDRVLTHANWSSLRYITKNTKSAVLLIDEVDVFFSDKFYGNVFCPVARIGLNGLTWVQETIWKLAMSEKFTVERIAQVAKDYIARVSANGNVLLGLSSFLNKPGTFSLLNDENGVLCVTQYTNQSFFNKHLQMMAKDAYEVAHSSDDHHNRSSFIINDRGYICCKGGEIFSETVLSGYRNVFNYFRLKGSNYDSKNFTNYGYLLVSTGKISYARLPSQFPLILGVSGTVTSLGEYEKRGVASYNIQNSSILPSFFGESNLKFNKDTDFHYFNRQSEWLKEIYGRANQIVESRRAVLIFFSSDILMKLFSKEYKTKFDRLNELTENTVATKRDAYIVEAGLPSTVTLATRGMGRGVDYKSSLSVEKNGGVHVIQTFYSTDIKEEIQIKGRTARKDNQGSYELILCKKHLVEERIIREDDNTSHSYSSLNMIRQQLSDEKGNTVTDEIEKCDSAHNTTMKYFGLA